MKDREALRVGATVRAFHPRRLGVVNTGTVTVVGRKYVTVDFGELLGGAFKVAPQHVLSVEEFTALTVQP